MNIKIPKSRFPIINNIEDLLPYIKDKKEIAISKRSNGTTVVCYNVEDGDTFSNDYAIECRGIVFDTLSGNIIGRPLHKFFNLGESERTRIENFNWNEVVAVWDKLDGSMITSHRVGKDIDFKTKKSFESDTVLLAKAYIKTMPNIYQFCDEISDDFTPIFEYTSNKKRIVIDFPEEKMTLLHVRHIKTGAYIPFSDPVLKSLIEKYKISILTPVDIKKNNGVIDIKALIEYLQEARNMEGYVIQFYDDMVKVKSSWYRDIHKIVTFMRERDVAKMCLNGTIDDAKAFLVEVGKPLKPVEDIEHKIVTEINNIISTVSSIKDVEGISPDMKKIAEKYKGHKYFSLIMNAVRDKENDYVDYYSRNYLRNFSLNEIYFE